MLQFILLTIYFSTDAAIEYPSKVDVPQPNSSTTTNDL